MPFFNGFPGNRTPVPGIRILTPNTRLDLSTKAVSRFWPREAVVEVSLDEAQSAIEHYTRNAFQNGPRLAVGLTAGIDSRAVVVAAYKASVNILTYTYHRGPHTRNDINVARIVAKNLGFEHVTVTASRPSQPIESRLREATYYNHHFSCVEPLAEALDGRAVASGHLLEIGRLFYADHRRHGRDLSTPEQMTAHFVANLRRSRQAKIEEYGLDRWMATASEAFAEFNAKTDFQKAAQLIDPFDLFYWEHRMGTWQSLILLERDFYAEPYMPFNSRVIFTAMLGLPPCLRQEARLFERLTDIPEISGIPITSSSTASLSSNAREKISAAQILRHTAPIATRPQARLRAFLTRLFHRQH